MSQRKGNKAPDKNEHAYGLSRLACDPAKRIGPAYRILVSGRNRCGHLDCFGNLAKALTFFPERAAGVAKCRVSEHTGLIHPLDAGQDRGRQQQATPFDQIRHLREVQLGLAKYLRGAVLGGLGHGRIFRVHLLHGLLQLCHVVDHRKNPSGDSRIDGTARSGEARWRKSTAAPTRVRLSSLLREPDQGHRSPRYRRSSTGTARIRGNHIRKQQTMARRLVRFCFTSLSSEPVVLRRCSKRRQVFTGQEPPGRWCLSDVLI